MNRIKELLQDFEKRYFEGVERFEENTLALYDPDEIIKEIVEDNYFSLSIIEIRDFINKCLDFYNEYEKKNPKIFEDRKRAIEENEALDLWEEQWLSPN